MSSENSSESGKPTDVWVGTNLGILKGISLASREVTSYYHKSLETADKTQEVCAMCWEHNAEGKELYCGLRNGMVQRFSCERRVFEAECDCTGGEGVFVGLARHGEVMITCTDQGDLCFWPPEDEKTHIQAGRDVCCMAASPDHMLQVATGGKENDLKVWDGNNLSAPIFQAKNVKNDKFDLRVPVWVKNIGYVAGSGSLPTLAVATGHHQVRLYDTRAQRRPVYSQEHGEHPFTTLTVTQDGLSYVVGNTVGDIMRCDLRTGGVLNRYTGCTGGVRSLQTCCYGGETLLASCSLDRFLRVFTLESPKLLHKVYLKLLPCRLLFCDAASLGSKSGEKGSEETGELLGTEEEEEDVWASLQTVKDKKRKSRSSSSASSKRKRTK